MFPATSSAYAAMGATINPYGLEVRELEVQRAQGSRLPGLIIEGEVHNISDRNRDTLPLRAALLDDSGAVLVEWMVVLESPELPPEGRERFRTELPDPPVGAREVKVVFAPIESDVSESDTPVGTEHEVAESIAPDESDAH